MDNGAKIRYSVLVVMVGLLVFMGVRYGKTAYRIAEPHVASFEVAAQPPANTHRAYAPYVMNANTNFNSWYYGTVVKVVDGDTIDVRLDLGMDVSILKRIRMAGINAPEMSEAPRGDKSKQFLNKMLEGKTVIVKTDGDDTDRYGRILATVFTEDGATNVNDVMVKSNQAIIY